jgi:CYTH domain-containing protein/predicted ATPase
VTKPREIVLTGGPCAGKTSALRHLTDHLSGRGWRVLVVPEAATLFITGGVHDIGHLAGNDRPRYLAVQANLLGLQNDLRNRYLALADGLNAEKTVLIFDRGELDNRAYMSPEEYQELVEAAGTSIGALSARYDAVLHLVTAADGTPEAYTLANNEARSETPEQAIALDRATLNAWVGHSHLHVIGNEGNFDTKLTRTLAAVLGILGEPEPVEVERKFLLASPPPADFLANAVPVQIEQMYLPADGPTERRIRARTHDEHTTYFHTTKSPNPNGPGRIEHEAPITAETYRILAELRDPATRVIRKNRYCLVENGQHFELDQITGPNGDIWVLEAELVSADDQVTLPAALTIAGEVTDSPLYRNAAIARAGWPFGLTDTH